MCVCNVITFERLIGQKSVLHHQNSQDSGMVLGLNGSLQLPVCSADYKKNCLMGWHQIRSLIAIFIYIIINVNKINHVFCVYFGIDDTNIKQNYEKYNT